MSDLDVGIRRSADPVQPDRRSSSWTSLVEQVELVLFAPAPGLEGQGGVHLLGFRTVLGEKEWLDPDWMDLHL